jgi:hypothetical protein
MAQILVNRSSSGSIRSYVVTEHWKLLIDLALEWNDFAMWEDALKADESEWNLARLGLDVVIRAWDVFTFDRVKSMLVHSTLPPCPVSFAHLSHRSIRLAESRRLFTKRWTQGPHSTR